MIEKVRVLFVLPSLGVGGAERQVVDLVNNLDDERFDATVFTFERSTELLGALDRSRIRFVNVPRRFKFDLRPVFRLARVIREHRIMVVHCTLQFSLLIARLATLLSGRRLAMLDAVHTTVTRSAKLEWFDRLLYVPIMRGCRRVVTVCETQRAYWEAKYPALVGKTTTVYNGIDLDKFRDDVSPDEKAGLRARMGIGDGDVVVGMVAAIRPEKNHEGVLEVATRLKAAGLPVKFVLVGGPPTGLELLEARLRRRTVELGLERIVHWVGKTLEPKKYLSLCDVAILFSTSTETFPLSLLECLAMGVPVVSSRIGGVPEIVEHGSNGMLVPIGDVGAFVAALTRVISDAGLRHALAKRARASVASRFSVSSMVRQTERVLLDAVASGA